MIPANRNLPAPQVIPRVEGPHRRAVERVPSDFASRAGGADHHPPTEVPCLVRKVVSRVAREKTDPSYKPLSSETSFHDPPLSE